MDQTYLYIGFAVLLVVAFVFSTFARKAMRYGLYLLSLGSLGLSAVCVFAISNANSSSGSGSAGLLLIIIGAGFFAFIAFITFLYARSLGRFEAQHVEEVNGVKRIKKSGLIVIGLFLLFSTGFLFWEKSKKKSKTAAKAEFNKKYGMSPLLAALSARDSRKAEELMRTGAEVGEKEMRYAIVNVDAQAIRVALSKNPKVPPHCKDCVKAAARLGDSDLTSYLLIQLEKTDERGNRVYQAAMYYLITLMHWDESKKLEYEKTFDFLVSRGAKPDALYDGYLALTENVGQFHLLLDRFEFLKRKGANLNTQDKDGNTYLHWLAQNKHQAVTYEKLVALGLDPSIRNNLEETPAEILARSLAK